MIKVGVFVTSCSAGYWQLLALKPKIATEDYDSEKACWQAGDKLGQWAILKKAFTPKMKPKIDFEYVDASWLQPVSIKVQAAIDRFFSEKPDDRTKFDAAETKLKQTITSRRQGIC